jgi:hypothetical protein
MKISRYENWTLRKLIAMKYSRRILVIKNKNVLMYSFQPKSIKLSKDEEKKDKGSNRPEKN